MRPVVPVGGFSLALALAVISLIRPHNHSVAAEPAPPPAATSPSTDSAIAALIKANGGKVPATGEQLVAALARLGKFSQLPVPFSSVRLTSGLQKPRVVIAPVGTGISPADLTQFNHDGRLYLAANMEQGPGGTPHVTATEFISWNGTRRAFDFGLIEDMGTPEPRLQIVDGGKCFACHKNRGPILGVRPWSNTANDDILRYTTASLLKMAGTKLPGSGPFVLSMKAAGGQPLPDRFDGMTLTMADAPVVDASVRRGAAIAAHRDVYRMLTRHPDGRRALEGLFCAIAASGGLERNDRHVRQMLDTTLDQSFPKYAAEWVDFQKAAKLSTLLDIDPATMLIASGVRNPPTKFFGSSVVGVPGLVGGNLSTWSVPVSGGRFLYTSPETKRLQELLIKTTGNLAVSKQLAAQQALDQFQTTLLELKNYEEARANGKPGLTSRMQPSNPHAFVRPPIRPPQRPSEILNAVDLAETIGLTDGDRRFFAKSIADAAPAAKVSATRLTKEVFESAAFKDILAGGPIPDREEFKDRFVEGLDTVLKEQHGRKDGFAPARETYASGPRYDPKAVEENEAVVVPTSACLRCHEVAGARKAVRFDLIPPLAFDPFDKPGRAAWLAAATPKQKKDVLARLLERLSKDADMPPEDSPEHDLFKVKNAAAFAEVKQFLTEQSALAK